MRPSILQPAGLLLGVLTALAACDRLPSEAGPPSNAVPHAKSAAAPVDALRGDAEAYAARFGVSVDEALDRLRIQHAAGELNARLQAEHSATFAGLVIEHEPAFQVVARFTRDGEQALREAATDPALARVVRTERAAVSLAVLQARLDAAYARVRGRGIEATGALNLRENRPEVYVRAPAAAAARAAVAADAGAAVVVVDRLPELESTIYGGLPIYLCTTGFTVQNSSGTRGVTTSGHCPDAQSYGGNSLTFLAEAYSGSYDIQWHTRSGSTFEPRIKSGSTTRDILATVPRASQVSGAWLCKEGMTTGYTCGTLSTTSYCYASACTWVYVSGGSVNLSEGGDSGGPWFSGQSAYGSHTFGGGNDSGYMAIDYVSGIGVSVVLAPPPLSVYIEGYDNIRYYGTHTFEAVASGGTGNYTYYWTFQHGTSIYHSTQPEFFWNFGACDGEEVFPLEVTVTSGTETKSYSVLLGTDYQDQC